MKSIVCLLVLATVQTALASSDPEPTITRLENDFAQALVARDLPTFHCLLAANFVYTENGAVMNKDELIHAIMADQTSSASNESMKVLPYGDTVVVTGILRTKGSGKDGAFDRRYRFTDTWLRRNGSWQLIAAQDYLMPQ
jgi:ketosteroid isomerase-like protein